MVDSNDAFRKMKTLYGKRKNEFPDSDYSLELFTEKSKVVIKGEDIPTSFQVINTNLENPHFINYELKKDGNVIGSGSLKEFSPFEKKQEEVTTPHLPTTPLDIMKATFEMNRVYAEDLERVTKKYSDKFAEYDQEVEQRINKQKENLNEKLDSIEFANKRRMEIQHEEFGLERKRWELEKEQILARKRIREDRFRFTDVLGKVAEGAMEALSANPEQSVNLLVTGVKFLGKAWRGEPFEVEIPSS
ncbi:hypothetical protein [Leptospira levettii]|uniref:hypothetical protein n=1 Tax=Leptospira levettii TaxID=2023178 RepID=UPI00223E70EA|nr:hypothetical protein [Leptospira levettii]MCW7474872.1 hypothetical protein [Leptospira levettii]